MKPYLFLLLFLSFLSCKHPESSRYNQYQEPLPPVIETLDREEEHIHKVIGIKDGDTFVLLIDGKEQTVRLEHIDCPEKRQPFGTKAKQFASDLCFGEKVVLRKSGTDRYRRIIGEIILQDGTNVNKELVKNGLAWHFKKYSKDEEYAQLEIEARINKLGLWSDSNPIAPWEFRKQPKKKK